MLALHAADEDERADDGDPDLELRVGDEVLVVRLSTFLEAWAPRLPKAATWVLALCNPGQRALRRPASIPREAALWYGLGDVDSWADEDRAGPVYGLTANEWVCA